MSITKLITSQMKTGRTLKASSWRAIQIDAKHRQIWHYSTLMAELKDGNFCQVSNGWGSMSDKQGMNKLRRGVREKGFTEVANLVEV